MAVIRLLGRVVAVSLLVLAPVDAGAQYFGRNKVEYVDFDFRILATEHFDLYYYAREERAARVAAQLAERWYARLSKVLNHEFDRRQPLVLYGSHNEFSQTNVVSGLVPDSVGGVTDGSRRRIVMPFAPTLAETHRVLGHELVHAFQFDIARHGGGDIGQPLWFIEGMAEYLARGSLDAESSLWLRDAVIHERIPERQGEAARDLSPYLYGHAFWAYLGERFGDGVIERALKPDRKNRRLKQRMQFATGVDLETLHADWREYADDEYGEVPEGADRTALWNRDNMQLGPALSPDGRQAVFFSERDRLALDLFLAEVATGKVIRKIATTAASAKFDSLQPLRSTGAWSPDGRQFAFAAVRQGRASLMLIDMTGHGRDREIPFAAVGQILAPAWSPDGRAIAFSALTGGFTDLYRYDFETGTLTQLTDDAFADLQPAWSHDGRSIAFVSERFSSDLDLMRFGRPQLAILDVRTQEVRCVDVGAGRVQLNPQWSTDDRHLYFVGDVHERTNVYRVAVDTLDLDQVTNVSTGVNGITPTSPALALSDDGAVMAFTVYKQGRPRLVVLDQAKVAARLRDVDTVAAVPVKAGSEIREPGTVNQGVVDEVLADYATGLTDGSNATIRDYASRLSLEGIGQPYLSSGGGPFGTFVRGGGALLFGDMLGERRFGAAIQIGNRLRDAAFTFRFLNQERRWNWGAIAELEPSVVRYRRSEATEHEGEPALVRQADYLQRAQLRAAAVVAYPFSRGLRVEFTAGVRHAVFHRELRSSIVSAESGRVLATEQVESRGGDPTTVAEAGAALVRDTAVFGPTGPLLGSRYRIEVTPAAGELSYTSVIADVRKYMMPIRPYSIAMRLMHSARYGADARDPRLLSSFLGSSYLVRGHRQDLRYCRPDATRVCGDDLLGNQLLVGNVEIRVPFWGIMSRQLEYSPVPMDAFLFADGGMVWSRPGSGSREPGSGMWEPGSGSRRVAISSIGGGLRVNAGGLPLELAAIRALDGPAPRWQFELGFRVGF